MIEFDGLAAGTSPLLVPDETAETALVVRLVGEVDLTTAEHAADRLRAAEALAVVDTPAVVVLDLTRVTFLGSVGLAMMVEHSQLCAELGTQLCVVVGENRAVWRSIRLASLDQVLVIVSSVEQALARA